MALRRQWLPTPMSVSDAAVDMFYQFPSASTTLLLSMKADCWVQTTYCTTLMTTAWLQLALRESTEILME